MSKNLQEKIKEVKSSIVAIGFNPNPQQVTIIGSGFAVLDNKILTAAHLYNKLTDEQKKNLKAFVLVEQGPLEFERYSWFPITLIDKNDEDDLAFFQLTTNGQKTLLGKLEIGDSDKIELGEEIYFIGFPYAAQLINDGFGVTLIINKGIISNIKRSGKEPSHKRNWLIVDAISNPGNSGCPLLNLETNRVVGIMTIAFRTQSKTIKELDIREPMHIAGARPINLVKDLLNKNLKES